MRWKVTTEPTREPVTLQEAFAQIRVTNNDERDLISDMVKAARRYVERFTRTSLVTQTITLEMDWFSCSDFELPAPPLASVTSIKYIDTGGTQQTLSTDVYLVETNSNDRPGRIRLKYNQSWPSLRGDPNGVEIIYVAGFGEPASVPDHYKQAMKLLIGHWYVNREAVVVGTATKEIEDALADQLWIGRTVEFA